MSVEMSHVDYYTIQEILLQHWLNEILTLVVFVLLFPLVFNFQNCQNSRAHSYISTIQTHILHFFKPLLESLSLSSKTKSTYPPKQCRPGMSVTPFGNLFLLKERKTNRRDGTA